MSEEKTEYVVSGRGGYRPGAGRKAERGKTVVMRVPEAYKAAIQALIMHLDDSKDVDRNWGVKESEPVFLRSLKDKAQYVSFKTEPLKK